ncbi:hypothetical protein DFH27DRAFT_642386 [Peziza echinospora]|nr:hypothetical protein DFH27DRAFT_642386 [Peziza echinospora]
MSSSQDRLKKISEHLKPVETVAGDSAGKRLQGKVTIITGCNSVLGIGRATAHQFAQNGATAVYICDFDDTNLSAHVQEIHSLYPDVDVYARKFDAADEAAVQTVIKEALEKYGRLDVFFANAGVNGAQGKSGVSLVGDIDANAFMNTLRVNTLSVFLAVKHASKAMLVTSAQKPSSGGSIIATSSVAGIRSGAGGSDYSASKAAVISLMQTSAYQLQGTNIRCNAVCPGLIETGMTAPVFEFAKAKGVEKKIGQLNPLKRGGKADEIARMALFLASDESSYVNAQFIAVDGGLSGSHPVMPGKFH